MMLSDNNKNDRLFLFIIRHANTQPLQVTRGLSPDYALSRLVESNKKWADSMKEKDPLFFQRLQGLQTPEVSFVVNFSSVSFFY
jgi:hypothetical protein